MFHETFSTESATFSRVDWSFNPFLPEFPPILGRKNFFSEKSRLGLILCGESENDNEKFWKNFSGVKKVKKMRQN